MEESRVKVRFFETDALGHVNNASYFIYFEEARVHFFQKLGYELNTDKWHFILASTKCDFLNQAYFAQELVIETFVNKIGKKSFGLTHRVLEQNSKELIATGNEIVVHFDFDIQQSTPMPKKLKDKLNQYLISP
ncbi:MAG: acyl-CoA thioesterase [Bacillaceae bacterium]|nr:acyl-CoA thioesterase [Bacillaceae bacterium]